MARCLAVFARPCKGGFAPRGGKFSPPPWQRGRGLRHAPGGAQQARALVTRCLGADGFGQAMGTEVRFLIRDEGGNTLRGTDLVVDLKAGTATADERAEYGELQTRLAHARAGNPVAEAGSKL